MNDAATRVASPCNDVCRIDERSGWCVGCLRTLDEIAAWASMDDARKREVVRALAARRGGAPRPLDLKEAKT